MIQMLEQRAGEDNFKRLLSRLVITSCQPATAAGKLHIPPCLAAANAMFFRYCLAVAHAPKTCQVHLTESAATVVSGSGGKTYGDAECFAPI